MVSLAAEPNFRTLWQSFVWPKREEFSCFCGLVVGILGGPKPSSCHSTRRGAAGLPTAFCPAKQDLSRLARGRQDVSPPAGGSAKNARPSGAELKYWPACKGASHAPGKHVCA